jgi:hypothetical protein
MQQPLTHAALERLSAKAKSVIAQATDLKVGAK